nr:immunoglobulin heavy chain junction region [Macaca mulatta]
CARDYSSSADYW